MNIRHELENRLSARPHLHLNDVDLDPAAIRAIMISEVVPACPARPRNPPGLFWLPVNQMVQGLKSFQAYRA